MQQLGQNDQQLVVVQLVDEWMVRLYYAKIQSDHCFLCQYEQEEGHLHHNLHEEDEKKKKKKKKWWWWRRVRQG